ncbi:bifunctional folylpolyglutamate synthase/dihydrofolate synthase [Acidicapsa dinghuensis]|uniref:Dihydrofolate synthase/folylpolyglutamate synthase n=1 Tax=Acidicapsa dinghuensis TaxID=2218256 RepID=A0ABW1ECL2_9BACT|nr:folylpolyglutamate synthase/dihydrofolate synthase family protein [Acidicapsa dinghuensis]
MSYAEAIDHLSALVPELAPNPSQPRRKFSLDEIGTLCAALGDPQKKFPSVLIAGTNGKGSTASTLAAIARESGLRVGLYTSPHLDRVNERIRIGTPGPEGAIHEITDDDFARAYFRVDDTARKLVAEGGLAHYPSYFELLTAVAFVYFAEPAAGAAPVDLAVLEVGLGGRLDATNIVSPLISVITDISLDHQEWLGSTITLIAREKAGILRANGTLVTLPQHPEANQALGEIATELNVRGINAAVYTPPIGTGPTASYPLEVMGSEIVVDSPLKGAHQHRNIALAIATAVELAGTYHFPITAGSIERGIHATSWPGRLEPVVVAGYPEIVIDVAHNPAGAWALRAALNAADAGSPQVLIFGCLRDKPLAEMTQILFPIFDHVILAPIHSPRATPIEDLVAAAEAVGVAHSATNSVPDAIEAALSLKPARIVISGSVYLVGEARHHLLTLAAPQDLVR